MKQIGILFAATLAGWVLLGLDGDAHANRCAEVFGRKQPDLAPDDPARAFVEATWRRLYEPFLRATGRETGLRLLGAQARPPGDPAFPRLAMVCPRTGQAPSVALSWPLVASVWGPDGVDEDLLAMVLAHELGHRQLDFDKSGKHLGRQENAELRADRRGAFLAASAGFDARRIICGGRLDTFLAEESVPDAARIARREVLPSVVSRFEFWESVHTALTAMVGADPGAVVGTLEALSGEFEREREVLPELGLLKAVALVAEAGPMVADCWQQELGLEKHPVGDLRCAPLSAWRPPWGEMSREVTAARGCDLKLTETLMRQASRELDLLDGTSVPREAVAVARGCVAVNRGELGEAERWFGEASTAGPIVEANTALVAWRRWLERPEARPPTPFKGPKAGAWTAALKAQRRLFERHAALRGWVDDVLGDLGRAPSVGKELAAVCGEGEPDGPVPWLPTIPVAGPSGCPCGWSEEDAMVDQRKDSLRPGVVRLCAPGFGGDSVAERWLDISLANTRETQAVVHLMRPAVRSDLAAWAKRCERLTFVGSDERGGSWWRGECPALGGADVVLRSVPRGEGRGCEVERIARRVAKRAL